MPTTLAQDQTVDRDLDELRTELVDLDRAIASLTETLARTDHELDRHRSMLNDALDLRTALEHRVVELEDELAATRAALGRQYLVSIIRAKLLADIDRSGRWHRRPALERAARVEQLLRVMRST